MRGRLLLRRSAIVAQLNIGTGFLEFGASGYAAFVREYARSEEADGDYGNAAEDYALLSDKDAAFAALEKHFPTEPDSF